MSRPWMPLYVADYLADTGHLSTLEHGAYLLLIMHYWQNGGLPAEDEKLARIARLRPAEWKKVRSTLVDMFDAEWRHGRIDAELAKAQEVSSKRKAAGTAGASARYGKRIANANDLPKQTHRQSHTHTQSSSSSDEEPEDNHSCDDADFDGWYATYPRHVGKGQARKAYRAARKKADAATLLAGAAAAAARYAGSEEQFIPHPSTWLNGERWLDQPPQAPDDKPLAAKLAEYDEMYRGVL